MASLVCTICVHDSARSMSLSMHWFWRCNIAGLPLLSISLYPWHWILIWATGLLGGVVHMRIYGLSSLGTGLNVEHHYSSESLDSLTTSWRTAQYTKWELEGNMYLSVGKTGKWNSWGTCNDQGSYNLYSMSSLVFTNCKTWFGIRYEAYCSACIYWNVEVW